MDNSQIVSLIIGKILNIGGILQRQGNKLLLPFDLNQQQFSIFFEIAKAGKVQQKDMVNRLLLERANVSKVVKKLQKMGLITVSASIDDKRSSWLSTTTKGDETLKLVMEIFGKSNQDWINALKEEEFVSILDSLSILQTVLKDNYYKN